MLNNAREADYPFAAALSDLDLPSSREQIALLEEYRDRYRRTGLLPSKGNAPLWQCCDHRELCWKGFADDHRRADRGGITIPWVGHDYHNTKVGLLAHNLRAAGGLLVEMKLTAEVRQAFGRGRKGVHETQFGYRSMRSVAAVMAWRRGRGIDDRATSPESLIVTLDNCARLQTVKCSPFDGRNSQPSGAMERTCPDEYLLDDLRLARPTALLTFGTQAKQAVMKMLDAEWEATTELTYGSARLDSEPLEVFCLAHPSARAAGWSRSHTRLIELLRDLPTPES